MNYKPVVGIYGNVSPEDDTVNYDKDFVDHEYVKWLNGVGIEVMALHVWSSEEEIIRILKSINGVLFQGGDRTLKIGENWENRAEFILNFCINNKIPIWATCQGFQLICFLLSQNDKILERYEGDWGKIHGSNLVINKNESLMLKYFDDNDIELFSKDTQIYFHNLGVSKQGFERSQKIKEVIKITSIAKDIKGKEFISSFEGINKNIKIFATQFHPEKIFYMRELGFNNLIPGYNSYKISYELLFAFAEEVYANKNRIDKSKKSDYDFIEKLEIKKNVSSKYNYRSYFYQKSEA